MSRDMTSHIGNCNTGRQPALPVTETPTHQHRHWTMAAAAVCVLGRSRCTPVTHVSWWLRTRRWTPSVRTRRPSDCGTTVATETAGKHNHGRTASRKRSVQNFTASSPHTQRGRDVGSTKWPKSYGSSTPPKPVTECGPLACGSGRRGSASANRWCGRSVPRPASKVGGRGTAPPAQGINGDCGR